MPAPLTHQLNYLIWRYFNESGYEHSAFAFVHEADLFLTDFDVRPESIPSQALVKIVQTGIRIALQHKYGLEIDEEAPDLGLIEAARVLADMDPYSDDDNIISSDSSEPEPSTDEDDSFRRRSSSKASQRRRKMKAKKAREEVSDAPPPVLKDIIPPELVFPATEVLTLKHHRSAVTFCEFSKKTNLLATGQQSTADCGRIWDFRSEEGVKTSDEIKKSVKVVQHSNHEYWASPYETTFFTWSKCEPNMLATGLDDTVTLFNDKGATIAKLEQENMLFNACWSPHSNILVTSCIEPTVLIWDLNAFSQNTKHKLDYEPITNKLQCFVDTVVEMEFLEPNEGMFLCVHSNVVTLCNVVDDIPLRHYVGHKLPINNMRICPRSNIFATASRDKTVQVWSPDQPHAVRKLELNANCLNCRWYPEGKYIASGLANKTIVVNDIEAMQLVKVLQLTSACTIGLEFSHDCRFMAALCSDGSAFIYETKNWELLSVVTDQDLKSYETPNAMSWSMDSSMLAISRSNGTVSVFDIAAGVATTSMS